MTARSSIGRCRSTYALLALSLGMLLLSCDDLPQEPSGIGLRPPDRAALDDIPAPYVYPPYTVTVGSNGAGGPVSLPFFAYQTLIQIEYSGFVTETRASDGQQYQIGPYGRNVSCAVASASTYSSPGSLLIRCGGSDQIETVAKAYKVQGSGSTSITVGNQASCVSGPCYSYSGSRTVTVTVPKAKLKLTARDTIFDSVTMPDTVRFVASYSPTSAFGSTLPAQLLAWRWQGLGDSVSTNVTGSCMYPREANTCKLNISKSGTVYVDMRLNGFNETAELSVEVKPGELRLSANKVSVRPGEPVTFTAQPDPSNFAFTITDWRWVPDSTPGQTQECAAPANLCTTDVHETGTMHVDGTVSGVAQTASARVRAVSCPTGNPILDEPVLRAMLDSLWRKGNNPDPNKRRELKGFYFDEAGLRTGLILKDTANATPCHTEAVPTSADTIPAGWPIAAAHPHYFTPGDTLPLACGSGLAGQPYQSQYGGPSLRDWWSAKENRWLLIIIEPDSIKIADASQVTFKQLVNKYGQPMFYPGPKQEPAMEPQNWKDHITAFPRVCADGVIAMLLNIQQRYQ